MNKTRPATPNPAEASLIEAALAAAGSLGLEGRMVGSVAAGRNGRPDPGVDGYVEIGKSGHKEVFAVECKNTVNTQTVGRLIHQLEQYPARKRPILVTAYVNPPVAEKLRESGIGYLDTAGNASLDRGPLLVLATGAKPPVPLADPAVGRAFRPGGLQVVFALLARPDAITRDLRSLAAMSGVSLGTAAAAVADLKGMGYVAELNQAGAPRRLLRAGELLLKWSEQYGRVLRPKTLLGRFYAPAAADIGAWRLEAGQQWGGESAGDLLTHDLVPQVVTLYTGKIPARIVAGEKLGRTPSADRTKPVEFRSRFWNLDDDGGAPGYPDSIVPPVLVYADLMATGDARCAAIAERIHRQYVARSFR